MKEWTNPSRSETLQNSWATEFVLSQTFALSYTSTDSQSTGDKQLHLKHHNQIYTTSTCWYIYKTSTKMIFDSTTNAQTYNVHIIVHSIIQWKYAT